MTSQKIPKMTITQKIKILKCNYLSIQHISHLSCYDRVAFVREREEMECVFPQTQPHPPRGAPPPGLGYFWIETEVRLFLKNDMKTPPLSGGAKNFLPNFKKRFCTKKIDFFYI